MDLLGVDYWITALAYSGLLDYSLSLEWITGLRGTMDYGLPLPRNPCPGPLCMHRACRHPILHRANAHQRPQRKHGCPSAYDASYRRKTPAASPHNSSACRAISSKPAVLATASPVCVHILPSLRALRCPLIPLLHVTTLSTLLRPGDRASSAPSASRTLPATVPHARLSLRLHSDALVFVGDVASCNAYTTRCSRRRSSRRARLPAAPQPLLVHHAPRACPARSRPVSCRVRRSPSLRRLPGLRAKAHGATRARPAQRA